MNYTYLSIISPVKNIVASGRLRSFVKMYLSILKANKFNKFLSIEHLIKVGKCNDSTYDVCLRYKKKYSSKFLKIKVIKSDDRNLYHALNQAVAISEGKFVNVLNSDDFFFENTLQYFFSKTLFNTEIDLFCGKAKLLYIDKSSEHVPKLDLYLFRSPFNHQASFILKKLLIKTPFLEKYTSLHPWQIIFFENNNINRFKKTDKYLVGYSMYGLSSNKTIVNADFENFYKNYLYDKINMDYENFLILKNNFEKKNINFLKLIQCLLLIFIRSKNLKAYLRMNMFQFNLLKKFLKN